MIVDVEVKINTPQPTNGDIAITKIGSAFMLVSNVYSSVWNLVRLQDGSAIFSASSIEPLMEAMEKENATWYSSKKHRLVLQEL